MDSKVKVAADETGSVVVPSQNNPEYGYIRVQQDRVVFDDNGFMSRRPINAIINGLLSDLKSLNWTKDMTLPGNILIKESLTPLNKKRPELDYKVAGTTGIVCSVNGQPIYRKTIYTTASNVQDVIVKHDNTEAIRNKFAEMQTTETQSAVKANEAFTL